jgi:outer membrane protein, heavy metal efflux system
MMRMITTILVGLVLGMGPASMARAQARPELPEAVTLDRALQLLQEESPMARAARARVEVAVAERIRARVYPNPTLSYGGLALARGADIGPVGQHQIVIEQPILFFGQVGARKEFADLNVRAEHQGVRADLADRALLVRQAFVALLARQERVRVLEESMSDLERIEEIVRGRHKAGDRSIYDVSRLELEVTALRVELRNARTSVEDASGGLAALLGFPGWRPRASGELEPAAIATSVDRLWDTAQGQRPSIQAARARVAFARGGLLLARRERLPVPAIALGTLLTQNESSQSVFIGLSLPLPIFDRGQGDIASARAEINAQTRVLDMELAETRAELDRARTVFVEQRETLREVESQMLERIPNFRRMAEDSYRGGSSGILDLLDALRSVKAIRLAHLEQQEAVKLAEATLISVVGLDPVALSVP